MKPKFFIVTTVPVTFCFFEGQLRQLSDIFDVTAVSSQARQLRDFADREGVGYRYVPMERPISLKDPWSLARFIWLFARERPRIVHGNTPKGSFLSMIAAWFTRRPVRIYMCHGLRYQGYQGRMRKLLMAMERVACRCATHVLAVSHGTRETLEADSICNPAKLRVVGHGSAGGIDLSLYDPLAIAPADIPGKRAITFVFVGRVVKDKGVGELAEAFARLAAERDDVSLMIVGSYEDAENGVEPATRQQLENHPRIHMLGHQEDVRPYIRAAAALVLPSYREGLPTVPIEAGALGVPAIVSDIPGCREEVIDGDGGLVVPPRDADALYRSLRWAAEHPAELAAMGTRARARMTDRYDRPAVWARYREFYQSVNAHA